MDETLTKVFSVYIDAPAERIFEAITTGQHGRFYGYGGLIETELAPGGRYLNHQNDAIEHLRKDDVAQCWGLGSISGQVIEADPPRRLVVDWQPSWHEAPPTRVTWEISTGPSGLSRVVLTHDLSAAPAYVDEVTGGGNAEEGGGGWPWVLDSLKTYLETGRAMTTAGA